MLSYKNDLIWFKQCLNNTKLVQSLLNIQLIIADVDGSLTDAKVYVQDGNDDLKGYSTQDGYAISKAISSGLNIAFLTGKIDKSIKKRAQIVGIPEHLCHLGADKNKSKNVQQLQKTVTASKEQTLFFGDDHLDIEAKPSVGLFVCPSNAPFYVQHNADLILPKEGGNGAFRLLLDLILFLQNKHFAQNLIQTCLT